MYTQHSRNPPTLFIMGLVHSPHVKGTRKHPQSGRLAPVQLELAWGGYIIQNRKSSVLQLLLIEMKNSLKPFDSVNPCWLANSRRTPRFIVRKCKITCMIETYSVMFSNTYSAHVRSRAMISNHFGGRCLAHTNTYSIYFETTPPILIPVQGFVAQMRSRFYLKM